MSKEVKAGMKGLEEALVRMDNLEGKLNSGLVAIDTLTDKLINLAVIENEFLKKIKEITQIEVQCRIHLMNMVEFDKKYSEIRGRQQNYFQFRYKWMERFFIKWSY